MRSELVSTVAHTMFIQSSELIMSITQHYVLDEKIVRVVTREMVLDIRPDNIERASNLPSNDSFISISYEGAYQWYREHQEEIDEIIQRRYLIERTPRSNKPINVDYSRGYMKVEIRYYIVSLSRVMGLKSDGYLDTRMV